MRYLCAHISQETPCHSFHAYVFYRVVGFVAQRNVVVLALHYIPLRTCISLALPVFSVFNTRRKFFVGNVQVIAGRPLDVLDLSQSLRGTRVVPLHGIAPEQRRIDAGVGGLRRNSGQSESGGARYEGIDKGSAVVDVVVAVVVATAVEHRRRGCCFPCCWVALKGTRRRKDTNQYYLLEVHHRYRVKIV